MGERGQGETRWEWGRMPSGWGGGETQWWPRTPSDRTHRISLIADPQERELTVSAACPNRGGEKYF